MHLNSLVSNVLKENTLMELAVGDWVNRSDDRLM